MQNECYAVLGIVREMPTQDSDYSGPNRPKLPNGTVIHTFGFKSTDDPLKLEASKELMGNPGKFLVGYQLGYLDHHNAAEISRVNDPAVRKQLFQELRDAGMQVDDSEIKLHIHMDSDQFQH